MSSENKLEVFVVNMVAGEKTTEILTFKPDLTLTLNLKEFFVIALRSGWIEDLVLKEMAKNHSENPIEAEKEK